MSNIASRRVDEVNPMTPNQDIFMKAIKRSIVTIATGPAGCGKTFLSCYIASKMLKERKIKKIVICRPLVVCGSEIGALPGDVEEKVTPFMIPILDKFEEFFERNELKSLIESKAIDIQPLELMRGASIPNAFILLDEAQNATIQQLRMLLTRFGQNSKVVITGDASQSDLDGNYVDNPLIRLEQRFENQLHENISIVHLTRADIIRHPLLRWIDERLSPDYQPDDHDSYYWASEQYA